jgi:hypothetical protein
MILPNGLQNAYEDIPEHVKELVKNSRSEKGQRLMAAPSRQTLVQRHKEHLKLLGEGNVPIRNIVLPLPYPPSCVLLEDTTRSRKVSTSS